MALSIVAIAPRLCVPVPQQFRAFLAVAAMLAVCACGGSPESGVTPSPLPASSTATTPPPFPPPPYTFTGTVRDSRRNAVGDAEIWLYGNGSPIDDRRGTGFADGSGRYTIVLQRTAQSVRAMKDGYVPNDASIFASSNTSTTFVTDVTIRKIDRYTLLSPSSITVGELVRMQGRAELDDGSSVTGGCVCFSLVSSDPSVVAVDGTGGSGMIRGVASGSATITATYYGVQATLVVRVNP